MKKDNSSFENSSIYDVCIYLSIYIYLVYYINYILDYILYTIYTYIYIYTHTVQLHARFLVYILVDIYIQYIAQYTQCLASQVAQVLKNPPANVGRLKRCWFNSWVGKILWRRAWQPTLIFLPEESHGQKSLAGCSPWGHTESDMTEGTQHAHMSSIQYIYLVDKCIYLLAYILEIQYITMQYMYYIVYNLVYSISL